MLAASCIATFLLLISLLPILVASSPVSVNEAVAYGNLRDPHDTLPLPLLPPVEFEPPLQSLDSGSESNHEPQSSQAELEPVSLKTPTKPKADAKDPLDVLHPDPHRVFHRPSGATIDSYISGGVAEVFAPTVNPPMGHPLAGSDSDSSSSNSGPASGSAASASGSGSSCRKDAGCAGIAGSRDVHLRCMDVDLSRFGFGEGEKKRFCVREGPQLGAR